MAVSCMSTVASAQRMPDINGPKQAAQRAVDAENARLSAQTGQAVPTRRSGPAVTTTPPAAAATSRKAGTTAPASAAVDSSKHSLTREVFSYPAEARRDPYFSLILTEDLRPLLSDLKLVGILYAAAGGHSVAIMRDLQTNAQYRVNTGTTLGRLRVYQIRPRSVIFSIDEFGLSRQDSLVLVDSTQMRMR